MALGADVTAVALVNVADGNTVDDDEDSLAGDVGEQGVAGGPPGGPCELATAKQHVNSISYKKNLPLLCHHCQ